MCSLLISAPVPLCPGLSSSPTVCEFIHRKCREASPVAELMRSDVASPASQELSMSGRSARGKQTVDKIFNTALPVHGSNTSEKAPLQNLDGKKIFSPSFTSHTNWMGVFIALRVKKQPVNEDLTEPRSRALMVSSSHDVLWIANPPFPDTGMEKRALLRAKVQKCSATFSKSK